MTLAANVLRMHLFNDTLPFPSNDIYSHLSKNQISPGNIPPSQQPVGWTVAR